MLLQFVRNIKWGTLNAPYVHGEEFTCIAAREESVVVYITGGLRMRGKVIEMKLGDHV